jgi:hypothetical protein
MYSFEVHAIAMILVSHGNDNISRTKAQRLQCGVSSGFGHSNNYCERVSVSCAGWKSNFIVNFE